MQLRLAILLLCFLSKFLCIGNSQIDSLLTISLNEKNDISERANSYCAIANHLIKTDSLSQAIQYLNKGLELVSPGKNDSTRIYVLNELFNFYFNTRVKDLKKSKDILEEIITINKKNQTSHILGIAYQRLSSFYRNEGNLTEALRANGYAFEIFEKENNKRGIAGCYNSFGILASMQNDLNKTLRYFLKAKQIFNELNDEDSQARLATNIGKIYFTLGYKDSADYYFNESIEIWNKLGKKDLMAITKINVASTYTTEGKNQDLNKAKELLQEAEDNLLELNEKRYLSDVYTNLANVETIENNHLKAIYYLKKSIEISEEEEFKSSLLNSYSKISDIYLEINDYKKSHEFLTKYLVLKAELDEISKAEELAKLQIQFDTKEQEKEIENLKKDQTLKDLTIEKQERELFLTVLGILLVIAIATFIFIGYRNKARLNNELTSKNIVIEQKNKEILDSITYAKRLQEAILPPNKLVKEWLPESFIFYKPKDIVSGDFYWMESIHDKIYFAAIDCTGHGVPGAMVSLVGHNAINRCIKEFNLTKPSEILDKLSYLVEESLSKSNEEVKDGMDISLCALDLKTYSIEFSGANNPLWVLRDSELIEIKGDKQPIGKHIERKAFTNHQITLQKNDSVYLFTDGYADQFGGEKGKKFKYSQFKELLISIQNESMEKQRELISESFESWKGKLEQLDDVCVIGVRV
jgi:serine phosphatase RsbU (regulator of sigma subunit)